MNYLLITFILVLLGVVVYQYIKINKLNNDKIDYKVKYESIKTYVEESKTAPAQKASKAEKADKAVKRGRKPKK